ncbi:MAG: hypothetical protein IT377_26585 [Polyangiaceae bacterium]|nr:hypothetical protein [Polyangiaceae bacterium]
MRLTTVSVLALASSMLFAACGGDSDAGGSTSVAIEDLPAEVAKAQCALYAKCFGAVYGLFMNGEECEKLTKSRLENGSLGQLSTAVGSGKVTYDGAKAKQCLDEIAGRDCTELTVRLSETCDQVAEGSVELGGDCAYDFDCKGTAVCKTEAACPGKCTERGAAGASCSDDDQCQDGLVCGAATQACVKPGAENAACGGGVEPECAPTLFCAGADAATKTAGTCKPMSAVFAKKAGESCSYKDGTLCSPELSCVYDALPPTSGKCAAKVASGAACKRLSVPSACPDGEYCEGSGTSADGTCTAKPGPGKPCAKSLGDDVCAAYSRCDGGKCAELKDNGSPCGSGSACYSGECVSGTCKADRCQ